MFTYDAKVTVQPARLSFRMPIKVCETQNPPVYTTHQTKFFFLSRGVRSAKGPYFFLNSESFSH